MIKKGIEIALIGVMSVVTACRIGSVTSHDAMNTQDTSRPTVACLSADDLLKRIAAGMTSEHTTDIDGLVASADDLLYLQGLKPSDRSENRASLTRQMTADVESAIRQFRERAVPVRVVAVRGGERKPHAPIENIAPAVDQMRDSTIVFSTSKGNLEEFTIGMLIKVGACWKVLYI